MPKTIELKLTEDEAEIVVDALDTDFEAYVEAANDARAKGQRADFTTFTEAAERVRAVRSKVQSLLE